MNGQNGQLNLFAATQFMRGSSALMARTVTLIIIRERRKLL